MDNAMDKIKNLTFGCEFEYSGITQRRAVAAVAAATGGTPNFTPGWHLNAMKVTMPDGRVWQIETDASVHNGCETVTPICTVDDIPMIQKVVRALREAGAKAHTSCGLHIHVGAADMTPRQIQNLVKIFYKQEELIAKGCGVQEARWDRYAAYNAGFNRAWAERTDRKFVDRMLKLKDPTMTELGKAYYGWYIPTAHYHNARYHALNLHNLWNGSKHTVEFRLFESTTHAGKVRANILLALTIVAFARKAKAASAKAKREYRPESAKYDLRVFLLRLGWIGEEFKNPRAHMMANLPGSTAWRDGAAHGRSLVVGTAVDAGGEE